MFAKYVRGHVGLHVVPRRKDSFVPEGMQDVQAF